MSPCTARAALVLLVLGFLCGPAAAAFAQTDDVDLSEFIEDGTEDPDDLLHANEFTVEELFGEGGPDAAKERRYCAKRLPDQMPATCRVRDVPVPDRMEEFFAYFTRWVARCVHQSRVEKHMFENDEAIALIWDEVKDRETARIHVHVDTFEFTRDGEVCLGVKSLRYDLERQKTVSVQETEPPPPDRVPIPADTDPEEDRDGLAEGFDDIVATQDPDALERAGRDSADCFSFDGNLTSAWKDMLTKTLLALPLSKLEGRYECLYDAFTAGYPVGLAAGILELPEYYVRNRLMYSRRGPPGGYFDCNTLSKDATDFAMLSAYRRMMALGAGRRQAQRDLVNAYIEDHKEEARNHAGPNLYSAVIDVMGEEQAHPDLVYWTAWAAKAVYGLRKPKNPMSPSDFRDCLKDAIEDAVKDTLDPRLR